MFIYAISCINNKFYIGKTIRTPDIRFVEHLYGNGSEWTKKYQPIALLESYETDNTFEEDVLTKKYMVKYGIENVRGGSYTKLILEDWQTKSLEHEFVSMYDLCYKCGKSGHFAKDCGNNKYSNYLKQFENTIDTYNEIQKLCKLRETIKTNNGTIQTLKFLNLTYSHGVKPSSDNSTAHTIEICPATIKKYYTEIKEYQKSNPQGFTIGMTPHAESCEQIRNRISLYKISQSNNFIEIMYNIYVTRVSLEKELNASICNAVPLEILGDTKIHYDNIILILDDMIEYLYEKYVNLM